MIRDVRFDWELTRVEALLAGDGVLKPVSYGRFEPLPPDMARSFFGPSAA